MFLLQVDGAVGLRCRSEADVSPHADARLLVELLSPKFGPRFNNSLRRSGSSRRSRNSPSVVAADRELSTLLGLTPDLREAGTAFLVASPERRPQSPRVTTCSVPQNQQPEADQMAPRLNQTAATHLSNDADDGIEATNTLKTTSDPNQQSDNGKQRPGVGALSDPKYGSKSELVRVNKADHVFSGNVSLVVEKCTLVPELKGFGEVAGRHGGPHAARHCRRDEEDRPAKKVQDDSQIGNTETKEEEEEEGGEEKVVVWCVTGVCEAAGELEHTDDTRTERDHRGGSQQASSAPANRTPSEPQPANEKPVPEPISSQPVPVPRRDDPSHPASSPMWHPAEPAAAAVSAREAKGTANQRGEAEGSTNEKRDVEIVPTGDGSRNKTASCRTEAASSTKGKAESANSSKSSTKNLPTSKTRPAGTKPVTAASAGSRSRPLRTLTSTENQSMRRVLPICRTSRGAPTPGKHPEKPPGHQQGSSSAAATVGPTAHNLNGTSLRRGEKSSTAPSSRRSGVHKTPDPKNSKDQKVSGTREQNQDVQRRPSIRKPLAKPKPPPEEKMCRSTLRSLSQASGGGGSVSAPVTPSHKAGTPSSSPLPGFARSTASSSFRRTLTPLTPPPPPPHSPHSGSISSLKSSLKTSSSSSSAAPSGTISPFTRTGSLRVSSTSTSSDLLKPPSSSALRRSQSIRAPPRSPLHDPLVPPKGHRRNDSGTFSDKSSHSRDSGKSTRRSWR